MDSYIQFLKDWESSESVSLYFKGGDIDLVIKVLNHELTTTNQRLLDMITALKCDDSTQTFIYFMSGDMIIFIDDQYIEVKSPIINISNTFYLQPLIESIN